MITLNGMVVSIDNFPDGTILMKHNPGIYYNGTANLIDWDYENDREFLALIYLVKHLRRLGRNNIELSMPYIPNARQDRVKNPEDVFTLKYFAELLNSLELDKVTVLDPHSNVSEALINNVVVLKPTPYIDAAIYDIQYQYGVSLDNLLMFYPDEGAAKRYSDMMKFPYAYGVKRRDWETGKIVGLDIIDNGNHLRNKDVLIVDDICSRGGTFYHSAKKLKELGVNDIYLYVSHCENTILEGELLKGDLIKRVYTTDSIFTKSHEKVEVM